MQKIYDLYNGKYDIAELSVDVTMAGQTNEQGKIEVQGRFPEKKTAVLLDFVQITFTLTGLKYYLGRILFIKGWKANPPFFNQKNTDVFGPETLILSPL